MKRLILAIVAAALLALWSQSPAHAQSTDILYGPGWNLVAGSEGSTLTGAVGNLYTLQPGDTAYESFPVATPLRAGWGYWAYFPTVGGVNVVASSAPVTRTIPAGQWAMLGNPFSHTTALIAGADLALTYDGAKYTNATELTGGAGVWVMASGAVTLSPGNANPPRETSDASSCTREHARTAYDALSPLVSAFEDGLQLARNTPRYALSPQIAALQATHRQLSALSLPHCASTALVSFDVYMEGSVDGMLSFFGGNDSLSVVEIDTARPYYDKGQAQLILLRVLAGR